MQVWAVEGRVDQAAAHLGPGQPLVEIHAGELDEPLVQRLVEAEDPFADTPRRRDDDHHDDPEGVERP